MRNQRIRLLLGLFESRFFEDDAASPGGGFQTNINQVLGFLVSAGLFVAYFLTPGFVRLSLRVPTPETEWALRSLRLFFPAYSFAVVGFATVFQWDTLFPDRRDFLILTPFPITLRELATAKIAALLRFLLLLTAAVNLLPNRSPTGMKSDGRRRCDCDLRASRRDSCTVGSTAGDLQASRSWRNREQGERDHHWERPAAPHRCPHPHALVFVRFRAAARRAELVTRMHHGMPATAGNQPTVDRKRNHGSRSERERETCPK